MGRGVVPGHGERGPGRGGGWALAVCCGEGIGYLCNHVIWMCQGALRNLDSLQIYSGAGGGFGGPPNVEAFGRNGQG